MSVGMIALVIIAALIYMGLAQRVLDRLKLNDKTAIWIIIAIVLTTLFIPNIRITDRVFVNIGGFIIPVALAVYLLIKADTNKERIRSITAAIAAGAVIYLVQRYVLAAEPEAQRIDPTFVYPIIAGFIAYLLGRSRRAAFIAGIIGMVISDFIQLIVNIVNNIPSPIRFGGAGGLDSTVIAGILAVLLAEIFGEIRERLQGGTEKKGLHFEEGKFVSTLGEKENKKPTNQNDRGDGDHDQ